MKTGENRKMDVRLVTERKLWNDFVEASSYGNVTQCYEWGELASHAGVTPLRVGVFDDQGNLCAAMGMLVSTLSKLRSKYLYVPRGPILADPKSTAMKALLDFARIMARKHHAFMLKVEPGAEQHQQEWVDALQSYGFRPSPYPIHLRNEWIIDIRPKEEDLLAGMKMTWRYNVRLATRKGVVIRRAESDDDIVTFHRLLKETAIRDNFFVHEADHYKHMMRIFGKDEKAAMFLAEYNGEAIAGQVLMRSGKWAWHRYAGSSLAHREVKPNYLLQWEAMKWSKSHGCEFYNLLGVPFDLNDPNDPLQGVYEYKKGFGGYARCSLGGYDLVYNPLIYHAYQYFLRRKRH